MLEKREQFILLELLFHGKVKRTHFLKETKLFVNETDFYQVMEKLGEMGLVHGSSCWELTWKGSVLTKILALQPNNGKDYTINLRREIIEFEYCPDD